MRTASGNKSGHILALIAVGFTAVADVCCCRWLHTRPRFGVGSGCLDAQVLIPRLAVMTGFHR